MSVALAATFAQFGEVAAYRPPGVTTNAQDIADILVMIDRSSDDETLGAGRYVGQNARVVKVRESSLGEVKPAKGARFITARETIEITDAPMRRDRLGLVWTCAGRLVA
jgi:hypothetical protein